MWCLLGKDIVIFSDCGGGWDCESGVSEYLSHLWYLRLEVLIITLDDAQPIYPDVLKSKCTSNVNDVLKEGWQVSGA
jgi:hypothetical protein